MEKPLIGLDVRCGRRISVGMRTSILEVAARLPQVAPEFAYVRYERGENLGLTDQFAIPLRMRGDRVDVAHYMAHYVPAFAGGAFVFTIHDLIHLRFPQYFKPHMPAYYATVIRRAARKAARIITSDERTIPDLVHYLGADPAKIRAIPLAPRERFFEPVAPHRGERPYLLYVGNHREHKDLPTLFAAWSALPASYAVDLYLTGPDDFAGELERRSTPARRAVALGDVSDEQLAAYYAGAAALVHPALLEGFGLPFVEAMAAGTAVIATSSSIPRPLIDVSLLFEPRDADALRAQIARVLDDEAFRLGLIERGRNVVRGLTWDRTARATADVYREVLEDPR
jgi:glycosyltransferase involved in cell wall biosynthesis